MKLENDIDIVNIPKQEIQAKINKELKYIGSMKHFAGHTLFEIDLITGEVRKAVINNTVTVGLNGKETHKRKVNIKADCYYIEALNIKNAIRKFNKILKNSK